VTAGLVRMILRGPHEEVVIRPATPLNWRRPGVSRL